MVEKIIILVTAIFGFMAILFIILYSIQKEEYEAMKQRYDFCSDKVHILNIENKGLKDQMSCLEKEKDVWERSYKQLKKKTKK